MPSPPRLFAFVACCVAMVGIDCGFVWTLRGLSSGIWLTGAQGSEPASLFTGFDELSSPLVRTDLRLESAASCSATACHGGPRAGVANPGAIRGSEYPLWLERDPHALSWRTFCSPASVAMMERLKIIQSGQIIDRAGYDNCLACHNSTRQFTELRSPEPIREGVGCSSCHGPSEKWRSTHFLANWDGSLAIADGFVPARDMLVRARMCASCHVGDRDRDMNHDIIAAGHPALHYEFATFHDRQPKHWRDERESDLTGYEASQWLAGQLAALDASLVLLEARADHALPVSTWPELAAYNCYACHQPLRPGQFQRSNIQQPLAQTSATTVALSHWNRFGVEELLRLRLAEGAGGPRDVQLAEALDRLSSTMQSLSSSPSESKQAARTARLALDAWLGSPEGLAELSQFTAQRLRILAISAGRHEANHQSWETAAQFYLASIAARQAWARTPEQLQTARELRNTLTFRKGTSSPQSAAEWPPPTTWTDYLQAMEPPRHQGSMKP